MGLDGFSMGNLGLNADMTSAQMAAQAEQIALKESEIKIKDVTELFEGELVKRKEEQSDENNAREEDSKKKQEDEDESEKSEEYLEIEKKIENQNPKEFSLRINYATKLIELYNNKEEQVLETIKAEDLMNVVSKLDSVSGVLVNRKI